MCMYPCKTLGCPWTIGMFEEDITEPEWDKLKSIVEYPGEFCGYCLFEKLKEYDKLVSCLQLS